VHDPRTMSQMNVKEALKYDDVVIFLKLGLPGVLGMSEWWMWEVIAFMAGTLGTSQLASHSIAYNYIPLAFMVPIGVSIGLTVRTATLLGEGQVAAAKSVSKWGTLGALAFIATYTLGIYAGRDPLIRLFTGDEETFTQTQEIWGAMCTFIIFDCTYGVMRGTMVGLGLQTKLSISIVLALWCFGLPLLYHFTFSAGQGLLGLWSHMPIPYLMLDAMMLTAIVTADWTAISKSIDRPSAEVD